MGDIARKSLGSGATSENSAIIREETGQARHPMMRGPDNDCSHHTHSDNTAVDGTLAVLSVQRCNRRGYVGPGRSVSRECSHCNDQKPGTLPCPTRPDCCCRADQMLMLTDHQDSEFARDSNPTGGVLLTPIARRLCLRDNWTTWPRSLPTGRRSIPGVVRT